MLPSPPAPCGGGERCRWRAGPGALPHARLKAGPKAGETLPSLAFLLPASFIVLYLFKLFACAFAFHALTLFHTPFLQCARVLHTTACIHCMRPPITHPSSSAFIPWGTLAAGWELECRSLLVPLGWFRLATQLSPPAFLVRSALLLSGTQGTQFDDAAPSCWMLSTGPGDQVLELCAPSPGHSRCQISQIWHVS